MPTRAPFLKTQFGGYHHRDIPDEDADLTHVGPSSLCGEYLRRFWQPVCFSDELRDLPHRVKILGEELVVFRDQSGVVGLLELHCSHRGTSLEFGLIDAKGIRCCYHGWLFAADGTILETPGEPADSTLKDRLFHGAYPVHESHGIVFAYMGPPDQQPPFPSYDSFDRPGYRLIPGRKYFYPCNWLQIMENAMDPAHTAFLHTIVSGAVFTNEFGVLPELEFAETPVGMIYIATRRVGNNVWARMVEAILPNLQQVAPIWEDGRQEHAFSGPMMTRWIVPLDDTNTMLIEFRHVSETEGVTPVWWGDRAIMLPGQLAADFIRGRSAAAWRLRSSGLAAACRHPRTGAPRRHGSRGQHVPQSVAARHAGCPGGRGRFRRVPRRRRGRPDLLQRHGRPFTACRGWRNRPPDSARDGTAARGRLSQGSAAAGRRARPRVSMRSRGLAVPRLTPLRRPWSGRPP